jgi:hypothetical protein
MNKTSEAKLKSIKNYYQRNKDRIAAQKKEYYQKNKDKIKANSQKLKARVQELEMENERLRAFVNSLIGRDTYSDTDTDTDSDYDNDENIINYYLEHHPNAIRKLN